MNIFAEIGRLVEEKQAFTMAVLVAVQGSSPQNAGAKVLFLPNGRILGTIGGGCMEAQAQRDGLDCLRLGETRTLQLKLDDDFGWDDGLICGGSVTLFLNPLAAQSGEAFARAERARIARRRAVLGMWVSGERSGSVFLWEPGDDTEETTADTLLGTLESATVCLKETEKGLLYLEPVLPQPQLLIAGAGHIGCALSKMAALCGFDVTVVDDRRSFANPQRFPEALRTEVAEIADFVADFPVDQDTYIAVVTRGHRHDAQVLRACLGRECAYLGMIGSRRKIVVIFEEMLRLGIATPQQLARVRSPMGLALGDVEVGEIAVSILAEMIAVRRGVDTGSIRSMQYIPPMVREALEEAAPV